MSALVQIARIGIIIKQMKLIKSYGFTFAKPDPSVFEYPAQVTAQSTPFAWKLSHKEAKAYVEGIESYIPTHVNIWGTDHLISPEFIQRIELAPQETTRWSRSMTFVDELVR